MVSLRLVVAVLFLALTSLIVGCVSTSSNLQGKITPVQATWLYGKYLIPSEYVNDTKTMILQQDSSGPGWQELAAARISPGLKIPVVLYLHGCSGMSRQAERFSDLLISEGYAVFMPDSFKRPGRRKCRQQGQLYERVAMRTAEVEYALKKINKLPWVDKQRIILMGFSEGGNTTDNWSRTGFAAHIIIGSACTLVNGTPAAPTGTPVLAVVGSNDKYRPGKSCKISESDGISKSIVIDGAGHSVAQYAETQNTIRTFLHQCCSKKRQ